MDMTQAYEKLGIFYLGKEVNYQTLEVADDLLLYKNKHLTTHAAIIGMTGSGKTGLGISLIEEAALDNIPSIIIDPKGDMGNLLLSFENLEAESFEPWIDEREAEVKGMDKAAYAQKMAQTWKTGIESWNQDSDRIKRFKNSADFTIYTPGSSAGVSLSVLSNFDSPSEGVLDDPDTLSYMINSTVSSLLALIGIKADPLKSKEYLLLSTILNYVWKKEESLTLEDIIGYVVNPPFDKIGVLPLKSFYSQTDRLDLATLLNNVLASPGFSSWTKGENLDIQNLLYDENAKPKVTILSISHLNDNERMFFVTLFLNKFISWMRRQSGTSSLKTMLYMDEIYGFFPATSNPPSKNPMLLLLKQARAYGVGITLATQNPIDLDYKGLSNIGTWFIGRLQTKQDKDRVIGGLIKSGSEGMDKKTIENLLSNIKSRVFLLKSAHRDELTLFHTRWVLSYLRGPISKQEIKKLMKHKKEKLLNLNKQSGMQTISKEKAENKQTNPPPLSDEIEQYFFDQSSYEQTANFEPYIIANATVRYYNTKRAIDVEEEVYLKYYLEENQNDMEWKNGENNEDEFELYDVNYPTNNNFYHMPQFILEAKNLKTIEKEFSNYLYHKKRLTLFKNRELKLESKPDENLQTFKIRITDALRDQKEEAIESLQDKYGKKREALEKSLDRAIEKLEKEEADVSAKKTDTILSFGMTILDAFLGRKTVKRSTTSRAAGTLRSVGRMYREKDDVARAEEKIEDVQEELQALNEELEEEIEQLDEKYHIENFEIEEFYIKPRRSDIYDLEVAVLWESR